MSIMKKKDLDFDLYKATNKMLTDYKDIETCLELYETENVLMPLMIHENYHEFINEISICQEYLESQKTSKLVGGTANTKPKIAILISGHIRNNNINKSFEHLNDYDYDVFIHTWDNFGFKGSETNL